MSVIDNKHIYTSINPARRQIIIRSVEDRTMIEDTQSGLKLKWWTKKHNPNGEIPTAIYLIGSGTVDDYYNSFVRNYNNNLTKSEFKNYFREMIKQGLIY